jgi:hypothetical protein
MTNDQTKSDSDRKAALARAVSNRVATGGMRIESQSDYNAVLVKGGKVNHVLHLILTLVTLGAWSFIWLALWIIGREQREMISVDDYGNVNHEKL